MRTGEVQIDSLHIGSKAGLFFPHSDFDYKISDYQKWLLKRWDLFWDGVFRIFDENKVNNTHMTCLGEVCDIDAYHRNGNEFWTNDPHEASQNAYKLLDPLMDRIDSAHFIKGTRAHSGARGYLDSMVAANYDNSIKYSEVDAAWYYADIELSGVRFDLAHHGKNRSKWAKESMLISLAKEIVIEREENKEPIPDVISRGHNHWLGETPRTSTPYAVQVPSWQFPYEFIYRIDPVVRTPHFGGWVFICENGQFKSQYIKHAPKRRKAWRQKSRR